MTPEAPASGGTDPPGKVRNALRTIGSVVAPTTLIAALLYWFGEVRIRTQSLDMGLDHSVFGFSNQDYIRRSVSSMFWPLGLMLLVALAWASAHWVLCRWAGSSPDDSAAASKRTWLGAIVAAMVIAGLVCLATGLFGAWSRRAEIWAPICLGLGVALISYAAYVWHRFLAAPEAPRPDGPDLRWIGPACATLVALLLSVALFWAVSDYAERIGHGQGREIAANLVCRPDVTVYSERPLHIDAEGVEETRVGEAEETGYRYRYRGLKLLLFSAGKYFLLPATWAPGRGPVVVLRDHDAIRLEFEVDERCT